MPFAPEPDHDTLRSLKQIDERLGLRYLPIGAGCWALTEKWGDDDPRRSRIRAGEMPPNMDFDILGFAPQDVRADDAVSLLTSLLRQKVKDKPEYQAMLDNCILQNSVQAKANLSSTREFAHELFEANLESIGGRVVSRGGGYSVEDGKVVGTPAKPRMGLNKSEKDARIGMADK